MHELSLAAGIVQLVEAAAARDHFSRVAQLNLEAGALIGVETKALRFALAAMMPGTCLEGAEITVVESPGMAWCPQCLTSVAISSRTEPCSDCGMYPLHATGGTELRVLDLMVFDD
jgi:hydrogenase nickel incorporation protein HypA/HybF